MSHTGTRHSPRIPIIALLALYSAVAVLTTYPLISHLGTHLLGSSDDIALHYWNSWWVQRALEQGLDVWQSSAIFYPQGLSLVTHNIAWINALFYVALESTIGGVAAFNLSLLVNLVACGLAAAIFVHDLTDRWGPSALAGLIYQAWPFRMHQLSHPNLASTQFIPLFLMFLMRTLRTKRWRDAILAAIMYALVGYTRWQLLIPATMMGVICALAMWKEWAPKKQWGTLFRLAFACVLAGALLALPIYRLYQQQTSESAASLMREGEEETMQTDLAAYITPGEWHWLLDEVTGPLYQRYYADHLSPKRCYPAYLGITAVALAIAAMIKRPRSSWPWLVMAGLMVVLALGPILRLNGQLYPSIPMPYRLMAKTEIVRLMRRPERYNMFLALPMAVLAGLGADVLLKRLSSRRWAGVVWVGLSALILAEYVSAPIPLDAVEVSSPLLRVMAQETDYQAVVNLPFDSLKAKTYMWDQITHGKMIVQGNASRMPGNAFEYIDSVPLLASLNQYDEVAPSLTDVSAQFETLARNGIGRIIIQKNLVGEDRVEHWRRYFVVDPIYEDATLLVYSTLPDLSREIAQSQSVMRGLAIADSVVAAERVYPGMGIGVDIAWASDRALDNIHAVSLRLIDHDGQVWSDMRYPLCQEYAQATFPHNRLIWSYYVATVPNYIPPGEYALALATIDPLTGEFSRKQHILRDITIEPRSSSPPAAVFGYGLTLQELDTHQEDLHVLCELDWTATMRQRADYTVFVHVYDLTTGVPVAQDDSMPRRGAYPTRFWWPGEEIEDTVNVWLDDVAPGTYGLCVGVYDAATGERLPVRDGQGNAYPDGRLILEQRITVEQDGA